LAKQTTNAPEEGRLGHLYTFLDNWLR